MGDTRTMEDSCEYSTLEPIRGKVEYRRTTHIGDHYIEEVFEGSPSDIIELLEAIEDINTEG